VSLVNLATLILLKIIPVRRQTVGLRQNRWPARKERSFASQLPLHVMPTEVNAYHQYTLENQSNPAASLELPHQLRKYRAKLQRDALLDSKQTSLDSYFTHTQSFSSMADTEYTK
jgi:hypothetical protein